MNNLAGLTTFLPFRMTPQADRLIILGSLPSANGNVYTWFCDPYPSGGNTVVYNIATIERKTLVEPVCQSDFATRPFEMSLSEYTKLCEQLNFPNKLGIML